MTGTDIPLSHPGRLILSYGIPALSLLWLIWTAIDFGHLQGWAEAQGSTHFRYPTVELGIALAAMAFGMMLTRTRFWITSPAIAIMVVLMSLVYWFGTIA
jgi:hypothetical protein